MEEFTEEEQKAYKMLFDDKLPATEVASKLQAQGYQISVPKVLSFKQVITEKLDREVRKEHMMDNMLVSFDRTKIEFEDLIKWLKEKLAQFDSEGKDSEALAVAQQIASRIDVSLKSLGKMEDKMFNIKAKNVNLIGASDFTEAFKQILYGWFDEMQVKTDGNKLILEKPSPELLDDFQRWETNRMRKKSVEAKVVGSE